MNCEQSELERTKQANCFVIKMVSGIITVLIMWFLIIPYVIFPITMPLVNSSDYVFVTNLVYAISFVVVFVIIVASELFTE